MLGTIDLFPLQLSSPSFSNITFCPASHHFWPQQTISLASSQNMVLTCVMEKILEVSEQNFTEGKALHYLRSVLQCAKLCFAIKNFIKLIVMVLNFFNLVLKKVWRMILKNVWEPW